MWVELSTAKVKSDNSIVNQSDDQSIKARELMAYVVTRACIGCKDTSCANVCPVEAFHEGPTMLFINPEVCIDCEACVVECPVSAIHRDEEVPEEFACDIELNRKIVDVLSLIHI